MGSNKEKELFSPPQIRCHNEKGIKKEKKKGIKFNLVNLRC